MKTYVVKVQPLQQADVAIDGKLPSQQTTREGTPRPRNEIFTPHNSVSSTFEEEEKKQNEKCCKCAVM